jgi:hypothetical protein
MTRLVALVLLVIGCDSGNKDAPRPSPPAPAPPPAPLPTRCQRDEDCILRNQNPCDVCTTCIAVLRGTPAPPCEPRSATTGCAIAQCPLYTATCVDGACTAKMR